VRGHRWLRFWRRGIEDVVFPPVCLHCRGLVEGGAYRHLCVRCASAIEFARRPLCPTCGHPHYGSLEGDRQCPHCINLDPAYGQGRTAVLLRGPVRSLLIEFKYRGGRYVLGDLATMLAQSRDVIDHVRDAVLVPVPLHPRRQRERGYNQSELLARVLAMAAGGATRTEKALRRISDTRSQTSFGRRARQANLKNAFALSSRGILNPRLRHILVDDVFTTGSTLNSCARMLRRAGCKRLDVVTLAHG
jgi:ComF family protein